MKMIFRFVLLLIFVIGSGQSVSGSTAAPKKLNVFYLNSYHNGYPWSDNMAAGIREEFEGSEQIIQVQIEYLNSKKYYDEVIKDNLFRHFAYKFRNKKFDIIIVSDNNALEFILEYGENLFPGVPIVFCGINDLKQYEIKPGRKITGVLENIYFKENLDFARSLHPEVEKMIVIGNNSVTSISISGQIKESIRVNNIDFDIQFRNDLRSEDLIESLKHESKKIMLYIIPAYEEIHGEFYSSWELTQKVFKATKLPVYGSWEFIVGYGMVGGKVSSAQIHGKTAAQLALRIMNGEDAASIPIFNGGYKYIFDHNVLEFFDIPRKMLPKDSIIVNEPFNFYRLNRTIFWFIVVSVVLLVVVVILLFFNTTQRKHANIAMKDSRMKLRMILDNIPQIVFWQDRDLRFMDVNRSFQDFFNIENYDDIVGSSDYSFMGGGINVDTVIQTNREVMITEKPQYRIRWAIRRNNQDQIWLEVNKIPFHDENEKVVGVLTTAEDITSKLNLEKQLRQSQKMEALGILSGGIAHDFNNILTSIINSAELAIEDVPIGSMTRKDLKRILNASSRGSNLVKQILTFSRPSHQEFRPINMIKTVSESLELIKSSLPKNISFEEDINPVALFCLGNPTQIHQIVMNLCTNSFQALKGKGGKIEVSLKESYVDQKLSQQLNVNPGSYICLSIADNGPGINQQNIDKIFDPFFSTKNKDIGTGLGLSVVHGIVKGHKGGISVFSSKDDRTEFNIYIPQMEEELTDRGSVDASLHYGKETILFVEDDADQRASVPRALETLGYKVVTAENAEDGLDKFKMKKANIDLIITDYDMPMINGFQFAETLRKISPTTPIIMVSGRQFEFNEYEYENIKTLIVKPYDKITISGAIRSVMNKLSTDAAKQPSAS
ncbi:MAG: ATP-binding protein [Proteobacteria bacterium]|nr:ATP-binding protein [Pseudomonadota bacterium]